jgi:membrane-bound ClpP family serine protease
MEVMTLPVDEAVKNLLKSKLDALEKYLNADVLWYYGYIQEDYEPVLLRIIEQLAEDENKKDILYIMLTTPGGSAIAVERYVNIVRRHYKEVNFIVPDQAYSAGTIFCMSGDKIMMNYRSVLGPIDPQVLNKTQDKMVPALGYLDKIDELVKKSQNNSLSQAEFIILKEFDLAELRAYEQAKELTIDQLKMWLVKYKFKTWDKHKNGQAVTEQEKKDRAEEIAERLSDSKRWKSHGRPINIDILENELRLKIEDFGNDKTLSDLIRNYELLMVDYIMKNRNVLIIHTRRFI